MTDKPTPAQIEAALRAGLEEVCRLAAHGDAGFADILECARKTLSITAAAEVNKTKLTPGMFSTPEAYSRAIAAIRALKDHSI